jgi:pilus assembly protein CpaE
VPKINVGILSPEAETREVLETLVHATDVASVQLEVAEYCASRGDRPTRRFAEANPDVIIVDMKEPQAALQSLEVLNWVLPQTWLLVSSAASDPQTIMDTMRAGAREFLHKPSSGALAKALSRYAQEKERSKRDVSSGQIYCVTSAKGGSGATSVAINLAAVLSEIPGVRVALIDLNSPTGDAAAYLNLKPQYTIEDAAAASSRLDPILFENLVVSFDGISVLSGPKEFRPRSTPPVEAMARIFEVAANTFGHIFLDVPSSLDKEHLALVAEVSSSIVLVVTPELPALWGTARLLAFLEEAGVSDKVRLLVNRSRKSDEISDREIETVLKHPVYSKLPSDYAATLESINSGKPVVSLNHSALARSYKQLAYRLTGLKLPEKRTGILGLFAS